MSERTTQTPLGWHIAGTVRAAYVAGVDPHVAMDDRPSGYLKSTRRNLRVYSALATDPTFIPSSRTRERKQ